MSVAPTDLARKRWRPVRKAFEKQEKLSLELTQAGERLSALQVELQQAAKEDREAYAEAIAAGRDEPPRKAEQLAVRIDAEQRRVDACVRAVENASDEVDKLRAENAMPWRRDVLGKITEAHGAYEASIREVERCREALADEVALHGWITDGIGRVAGSGCALWPHRRRTRAAVVRPRPAGTDRGRRPDRHLPPRLAGAGVGQVDHARGGGPGWPGRHARGSAQSGGSTEEPFIHVQSEPLKVGDTFFHPPAGAPPGKAGHGFWKVSSLESAADDVDAIVKAIRLETYGP